MNDISLDALFRLFYASLIALAQLVILGWRRKVKPFVLKLCSKSKKSNPETSAIELPELRRALLPNVENAEEPAEKITPLSYQINLAIEGGTTYSSRRKFIAFTVTIDLLRRVIVDMSLYSTGLNIFRVDWDPAHIAQAPKLILAGSCLGATNALLKTLSRSGCLPNLSSDLHFRHNSDGTLTVFGLTKELGLISQFMENYLLAESVTLLINNLNATRLIVLPLITLLMVTVRPLLGGINGNIRFDSRRHFLQSLFDMKVDFRSLNYSVTTEQKNGLAKIVRDFLVFALTTFQITGGVTALNDIFGASIQGFFQAANIQIPLNIMTYLAPSFGSSLALTELITGLKAQRSSHSFHCTDKTSASERLHILMRLLREKLMMAFVIERAGQIFAYLIAQLLTADPEQIIMIPSWVSILALLLGDGISILVFPLEQAELRGVLAVERAKKYKPQGLALHFDEENGTVSPQTKPLAKGTQSYVASKLCTTSEVLPFSKPYASFCFQLPSPLGHQNLIDQLTFLAQIGNLSLVPMLYIGHCLAINDSKSLVQKTWGILTALTHCFSKPEFTPTSVYEKLSQIDFFNIGDLSSIETLASNIIPFRGQVFEEIAEVLTQFLSRWKAYYAQNSSPAYEEPVFQKKQAILKQICESAIAQILTPEAIPNMDAAFYTEVVHFKDCLARKDTKNIAHLLLSLYEAKKYQLCPPDYLLRLIEDLAIDSCMQWLTQEDSSLTSLFEGNLTPADIQSYQQLAETCAGETLNCARRRLLVTRFWELVQQLVSGGEVEEKRPLPAAFINFWQHPPIKKCDTNQPQQLLHQPGI